MSGSSMIRAMSRLLTKSGTDGKAGLSRPSNVACTAPWATPGRGQHVLEPGPHPLGFAHRAVAPLPAEHARREASAAVARALVDCGHRRARELRLQIFERQLERTVEAPGDPETPRRQIDLERDREHVIANEERLVGRDRAVEVLHRRLELRRP